MANLTHQSSSAHDFPWFNELISSTSNSKPAAALTVAPMVDQSDLPFRLLARRYGCNLAYTPMIHAKLFTTSPNYRDAFWRSDYSGHIKGDYPLVAQFCTSDKDVVLAAAKYVEHDPNVVAVDINAGCPQGIAKRGHYGAFLLEDGDCLVSIVENLSKNLTGCKVFVKVRLLPKTSAPANKTEKINSTDDDEDEKENEQLPYHETTYDIDASIALYKRLIAAGASLITIHGRTRFQKGQLTGPVSLKAIKRVVDEIGHLVPIIANGGISDLQSVQNVLEVTGANGVMSSEGILENPALFYGCESCENDNDNDKENLGNVDFKNISRLRITREYLQLCREYPPDDGGQGSGVKCIKGHVGKFLFPDMQVDEVNDGFRNLLSGCRSMEDLERFVDLVEDKQGQGKETNNKNEEELSWYMRHRGQGEKKYQKTMAVENIEISADSAECFSNLFGGGDTADY